MKQKINIVTIIISVWIAIFSTSCVNEVEITPKRTILVYIAGENSLSSYASLNLKGMLNGAIGNRLNGGNLLVYMDVPGSKPCLLKIKEGLLEASIDTVIRYEEQNSADIGVMKQVLKDVFHNPAHPEYSTSDISKGLILWSHGTGWLPKDAINYLRAFGQDNSTNGNFWMDINELRDALGDYKGGDKLDFIAFDACYMGCVEVAYALRENADYILASPNEIIASGLPYQQVMKTLFAHVPAKDAIRETAVSFFNYYNENTFEDMKSASIAIVATSELEELAKASKEILSAKYETDALNLPTADILRLGYIGGVSITPLFDFMDFVQHIPADEEQSARFMQALDKAVIYKATTEKAYYNYNGGSWFDMDKERFCGLSSYVPRTSLSALNEWYKRLDWYKAVYE